MSWNGLDVVVFYESAIGYNILGQTAVGTSEPLYWIIMLKKKKKIILLTNTLDVGDQ